MRFITGLLFTFICLLPAGSMAQNKVTLSGKVIDQHGTPIAQATIAVENTTSGTYTDDRNTNAGWALVVDLDANRELLKEQVFAAE